MPQKQKHLSPSASLAANSSLAAEDVELDANTDLAAATCQSQHTCATLVVDHEPLPHSNSTNAATPRVTQQQNSSQLTSYDYLEHQDEILTPELCSPIKQQVSGNNIERTRLYFPPPIDPSISLATGRSSSVDGIKQAYFLDDDLSSDSFITIARISGKPKACRRALSSLSPPPLRSTGKFLPSESINLVEPHIQWVERNSSTENAKTTPSSSQNYFSSFFRILPQFSPSSSSHELANTTFHPGDRLPRENNFSKIFIAIPRFAISFLQYFISPWVGWLCLPEHFLRKKSFSESIGSSKFRRRKFMTLISIIYGIFCVLMFTSWILPRIGFSNKNLIASRDLKVNLLNQKINYSIWQNLISFIKSSQNHIYFGSDQNQNDAWNRQMALKRRVNLQSSHEKAQAPLNSISHMARFSKFHSKSGKQEFEEVIPILFQGTINYPSNSISACLFSNQFWLDRISLFLANWDGPVSLVVECFASDRLDVIRRIGNLRETNLLVKQRVDFHLVTTSDGTGIHRLRQAERMLISPTATNARLNLARFFSRSDMVWLVGDARVFPSAGLYKLLSDHVDIRSRVLDYGDAIIIPNFAFNREKVVLPKTSWWNEGSDLNKLAQLYIHETLASIPLPDDQWPQTRPDLLKLSTESKIQDSNLTVLTMYDQAWTPKKGPSNWTMWEKFANDATSVVTLNNDETTSNTAVQKKLRGGVDQLYPIVHYDLKYAPNVIVSRDGQPWCTERFDYNKAACVYQMYLTGTELWVMPAAWSITIEQIPLKTKKYNDEEALKELIASRLYSKFHQEACMHYGREFSSLDGWDDDRSKHAKAVCMDVLSSWGVGTSSSTIVL